LAALLVLTRFRRVPEPLLIAARSARDLLTAPRMERMEARRARVTPQLWYSYASTVGQSLVARRSSNAWPKRRNAGARRSRGTAPDASVPPRWFRRSARWLRRRGVQPRLSEADVLARPRRGDRSRRRRGEGIGGTRLERWDDIPRSPRAIPTRASHRVAVERLLQHLEQPGAQPLRLRCASSRRFRCLASRDGSPLAVDVAGQRLSWPRWDNTVEVVDLKKATGPEPGGLQSRRGWPTPDTKTVAVANARRAW